MEHATLMPFGPFLLRKSIRRSSLFDLWRAERRMGESVTPCLVRRLLPPYSLAQDTVDTFRSRVEQVRSAGTPGVMRFLELGEVHAIPYVAWADVDGWTLLTLFRHHDDAGEPMPIEVAVLVVRRVVDALIAAHGLATPLVHGALRPGSVWLTPQGGVLVGDFEVGRLAEMELTSKEGQDERAWRFMAPERETDWQTPRPPTDVYSCGALLLEALILGRLSLVEKRLEPVAQIPLLADRDVPSALLNLISGALAETPEARPSLLEFRDGLMEAAHGIEESEVLATYIAESAPPLEILDPLEKPATAEDSALIRKIARQKERDETYRLEAMPELAPRGASPTSGRSTTTSAPTSGVGLLAFLLLLTAAGYLFRDSLKTLVFGERSNLALVVVESVPDQATVALPDGRILGKTPLEAPVSVPPEGEIGVVVSKADYQTVGPVFRPVQPGGDVHFTLVLDPLVHGPATARIRTTPPGARVSVDGVYRGKAPVEVRNLYSGDEHVLVARLKGYQKTTLKFRVEPERPNEVSVVLEKAGGQAATRTGHPDTTERQATGSTTARARSKALAKTPRTDTRKRTAIGYLVVDAIPGARITIDGEPRGTTDPKRKIPLTAGIHVLKLERVNKGQIVTRTVSVKEGVTRWLEYDFINEGWRMPPQHRLD